MKNIKLGPYGELVAKRYLRSKGFHILNENYYTPFGEIDIIARTLRLLIFVEVKARIFSDICDPPLIRIDEKKKKTLRKNANYYIYKTNPKIQHYRIDGIGLIFNKARNLMVIKHIKNIIWKE